MNAFILGGGASRRMKEDKALLEFNGRRLIDITIECTAGLFKKTYLVGRDYRHPLLEGCIRDAVDDIGPLGGILAALQKTDSAYNFFIGIDYPFISPDLILHIASSLMGAGEYAGCIPQAPDGLHPLFAFYGKGCLEAVRCCIDAGNYRVRCIARHARILLLPLTARLEGTRLETALRSLVNINSREEYTRLKDQYAGCENTE